MEDLIDLFEFDDELMKLFFESYITTKNELKALKLCSLTFKDLTNWRDNSLLFNDIKESVDTYFVSEIETGIFDKAKQGDFKSSEFILKHRSNKYNNKEEVVDEINLQDLVAGVISED